MEFPQMTGFAWIPRPNEFLVLQILSTLTGSGAKVHGAYSEEYLS